MTVQELKEHLEIMIAKGLAEVDVVFEGLPTEEQGYLTTIVPVRGAIMQQTPKGPRVVVR